MSRGTLALMHWGPLADTGRAFLSCPRGFPAVYRELLYPAYCGTGAGQRVKEAIREGGGGCGVVGRSVGQQGCEVQGFTSPPWTRVKKEHVTGCSGGRHGQRRTNIKQYIFFCIFSLPYSLCVSFSMQAVWQPSARKENASFTQKALFTPCVILGCLSLPTFSRCFSLFLFFCL